MVQEIMVVTPAIANLIREGKAAQVYSAIQTGAKMEMQTMEQALANFVKTGMIDMEEAIAKSSRPDELQRLIGNPNIGMTAASTPKR
jgi:twitching motility protein PilT